MAIACSRISSGDKENWHPDKGAAQKEVALEGSYCPETRLKLITLLHDDNSAHE
jgi:hypothetical protein